MAESHVCAYFAIFFGSVSLRGRKFSNSVLNQPKTAYVEYVLGAIIILSCPQSRLLCAFCTSEIILDAGHIDFCNLIS